LSIWSKFLSLTREFLFAAKTSVCVTFLSFCFVHRFFSKVFLRAVIFQCARGKYLNVGSLYFLNSSGFGLLSYIPE
jgi:hypothetical protein